MLVKFISVFELVLKQASKVASQSYKTKAAIHRKNILEYFFHCPKEMFPKLSGFGEPLLIKLKKVPKFEEYNRWHGGILSASCFIKEVEANIYLWY